MNSEDSPPTPSGPPPLDPALEARIVACVLGEASAFESAEIERLCAEHPEVAAFRRQISEAHGWIAEAVRPAPANLRLAPARRAKLLATLGGAASAAESGTGGASLPAPVAFPQPRPRRWTDWALPAAACLSMLGILAAIVIPTVGTVREDAQSKVVTMHFEAPETRANESLSAPSPAADRFASSSAEPATEKAEKEANVVFAMPPPAPAAPAPSAAQKRFAPQERIGAATVSSDARRHRVSFSELPKQKDGGDGATLAYTDSPTWSQTNDLAFGSASEANTYAGTVFADKLSIVASGGFDAPVNALTAPADQSLGSLAAQGRSQYAAGDLDAAQKTFRTAETIGADSAESKYFLKRIAEDKARTGVLAKNDQRAAQIEEVSKSWQRPGVFAEAKNPLRSDTNPVASAPVHTVDGSVNRKLREIIIPSISFANVDFSQAISTLSASGEEYDGAKSPGVQIVIESAPNLPDPKVSISMRNMSLRRVLDILTENAGRRYEVRDGIVHILPLEPDADASKPATPRPAPDASLRLETSSAGQAVSTFSLHVSDASFRLARAALARGEFPDAASVRPEEFYNAFDYGDPGPLAGEPVAARVEQAAHPFLQQRNLLRVALRVPSAGRAAGQPLRLTLLLDTSGSMEREDRAATVRRALEQLAALLGPADRVTLVGFARTPRLLADRLPGDQASTLAQLAADTPPEGGTNLDEALKLAADLALRQFDASAQNRIVLLTDGAANLGDADPAALAARVVQLRQKGIAFDACGVGANGLDDGILESLIRQGDGRYLLLNSPDEAGSVFAAQLAGAFRPAAQNVKVQVRFNPSRVPRYRLIGFEQHRLREQDFRDDQVDAAELAAAEAAVALYQIEVDPQGAGELGEVFIRFRDTATGQMVERSWPLPYDAATPAFDRASPSLQLAGAAALLAEKLRGGDLAAQIRLADLDSVAAALRTRYAGQPRVAEFLDMLAQARRLAAD